jgi:hypothetical protein
MAAVIAMSIVNERREAEMDRRTRDRSFDG